MEAEYAVRLDPSLERVGVLVEPASVVAKAWEQVDRGGGRSRFEPRAVLVTGAGPVGLLAALLGRLRGLEVYVLDRAEGGAKPAPVRRLGAEYHCAEVGEVMGRVRPDVVIEATGAAPVVFGALAAMGPYGVLCLTGLSPAGRTLEVDAGRINRELVLDNAVVVGTVNANPRHYAAAAAALAGADAGRLDALITRRVPLESSAEAFDRRPDDVKTVIELGRD